MDERRFWDRHAAGYARRPVADEAAYEHKLAETRKRFHRGMDVFEFGCGTGTTALHHAPYVRHIEAVDISPNMIAIAEEKRLSAGVDNVTFRIGRIEDEPEREASHDAVMAHSILHLLADRRGAIEKAYRMLKPGGLFITSTVCLKGVLSWLHPFLRLGHAVGLVPRVAILAKDDLIAGMTKTGFDIEYEWQPGPKKGLFLIARKPGPPA